MQNNNLHILSTRPLSSDIITKAATHSITVECISFIETEPVETEEVIKEIKHLSTQPLTVVFTSMNAVDAVTAQISNKPAWKIFCIGNTTMQLVSKEFGPDAIEGTAENAASLADEIVTKGFKKVYFFCGDQRRDELPDKLQQNGVALHELVVYKTHQTNQRVSKKFDGILFFSPSAVHSFFKQNSIDADVVLFAIGTTTAVVIKLYSDNNIIIAQSAAKNQLVTEAIHYFSTRKNQL